MSATEPAVPRIERGQRLLTATDVVKHVAARSGLVRQLMVL